VERNKGRVEDRVLRSAPVSSEQVAFPFAAQAARLRRHLQGHSPEEVCLITSLAPDQLDAARWLQLNRQAWGIESGLHQRLDVSHNDDRCRVRHPNSMLLFALLRRFANSLFMQWRTQFSNPDHKTTTDFQGHFSQDHHRRGLRFLTAKHPHLKIPS
jgi:hypothetical protein